MMSETHKLYKNIFSTVFSVSGEDMIRIKNGDHDERGQPRGEASVVKDEAAVHAGGGRAYDRVDQAGKQAFFPTVSAGDGAKPRGERNAVDIRLCGQQPGKCFPEKGVYDTNEREERDIAENDGRDVPRMLSVGGERQRREDGSDRGTREARMDGERDGGEQQAYDLRRKKDDIQISENAEPVNAEIDEADGHSEFGGKIKSVARAFDQSAVAVEGFSVHKKAEDNCGEEQDEEEDIHEYDIGIVEGIVYGVIADDDVGRGKSEGAVQKRVRANAENTDGKPRLIHIVASLYRGDTGEQSGNDKSRQRAENNGEDHAEQAELDRSEMELTDGVAE